MADFWPFLLNGGGGGGKWGKESLMAGGEFPQALLPPWCHHWVSTLT